MYKFPNLWYHFTCIGGNSIELVEGCKEDGSVEFKKPLSGYVMCI